MFEEFEEYQKLFLAAKDVEKPQMPNFDVSAYTDSEYMSVIFSIMEEFDCVDDLDITIKYLKGK